jgi:glycosidase
MQNKNFRRISWFTLVVFFFTLFSNINIMSAKAVDGGLSSAPVINADGTVTFTYENASATSVNLAGDMNSWSATSTPMVKNGQGVWTINVPYTDAVDAWTYKFVIDGTDWQLDPKNPATKAGDYGPNSLVNFVLVSKASAPIINKDGTVTFSYKDAAATEVYLAGSMYGGDWGTTKKLLTKNALGVWTITVTPPQDAKDLVYKYVVGSDWKIDPLNTLTKDDGYGGANSLVKLVSDAESASGVINSDGTITFRYEDAAATSVNLAGTMNGWNKTKDSLIKNSKGVWEITKRVGDAAQNVEYKFVVNGTDWKADPKNTDVTDGGNSRVIFPEYKGRNITIPGTLSLGTSEGTGVWNPGDKGLQLEYVGNGTYHKTFKGFKAGRFEYKVACQYSWSENYGQKGAAGGANIPLIVPEDQDITFTYNDDSHKIVTNLNYTALDITLNDGNGNTTKLTDDKLNGIYKGQIDLKAGTYDNITLSVSDGKTIETIAVDKVVLAADKTVTFAYDPLTKICFNDSSDVKVDVNGVYYDSRETEYKSPYGASPVDSPISFSIKVKNDMAKSIKMVIGKPSGTEVIDLTKDGSFDADNEKWTGTFTPAAIGTYSYYFVVSNGSDIKEYGDDDGFFGTGKAGELGDPSNYEFNVSTKDFKTPDWLKNAVIYQIYPDRFFNGDTNNDFLQRYARGNALYEFPTNWYSLPKDPDLYGPNYPAEANRGVDFSKGKNASFANDMYGGDLKGIEAKVNYLKSLGVTVLYMNPVGQSISSHRYDTTDYTKVDPLLGTMDDFVSLTQAAHKNGMHVVLDGVYNHVADDSVYFDRYAKYVSKGKPLGAYQYWSRVYDYMKDLNISQADAEAKTVEYYSALGITDLHYKDWFIINNTFDTVSNKYTYEGWGGYDSMPVIQALNGSEYNVKTWADEVISGSDSIARQWLKNGSNGWRLDVANEVSDETWRNFRKTVKSEGDNAIIGEIWTDASSYLFGDMYDSVMNYRYRNAVLGFVQGAKVDDDAKSAYSAVNATNELEKMREQYPREALEAMMNLVGSHDTQRVRSSLDGYGKGGSNRGFATVPDGSTSIEKMRLIALLQMTYIGAPTIYYGDEMGMVGCDDPDNRRGTTWGKGDKDLVEWYAQMTAIRSAYENLRTGDVAVATVDDSLKNDVMAYVRSNDSDKALVAANRLGNETTVTITTPGIEDGTVLTNIINTGKTEKYTVKDGKVTVTIPAYRGVILVDNVKTIDVNYDGVKDAYDPSYVVKDRGTPTDTAKVKTDITNAQNGSQVIISTVNEGISKDILQAIVDSKKTLDVVIQRGDFLMKVKDPSGLLAALNALGQNDVQMVFNKDVIKNTAALDRIKKDYTILYKFSLDTNLTNGILGTEMELSIPVGTDYDGKTLFLYYIDKDGNYKLIDKSVVANGILDCTTTHFSDYVVLDEELPDSIANNSTPGSAAGSADATGNTTKTGDNSNTILVICMLFVAAGTFGAMVKRKNDLA